MISDTELLKLLDFRIQKLSTLMYLYSKAKLKLGTRCRFLTYLNIIKFWEFIYDICYMKISDPSVVNEIFDKFLSEDGIANSALTTRSSKNIEDIFVKFFHSFSKPLCRQLIRNVRTEIESQKSDIEKISNITDLILEYLNIKLLELEGLEISCKCFRDDYQIECPYKDEVLVRNIIHFSLVPEYFENDTILPEMFSSFKMLQHSEQILMIVDFRVVISRSKEIDVHKLIDICNKTIFKDLISQFNKLIFYKPFHKIKENYKDKEGYIIVDSCEKLTKIIEEHKKNTTKIYCSSNILDRIEEE